MVSQFQALVSGGKTFEFYATNEETAWMLAERAVIVIPGAVLISVIQLPSQLDLRKPILSKDEAAQYLCCSIAKIDHLVQQGRIAWAFIGYQLFRRADLDHFIASSIENRPKAHDYSDVKINFHSAEAGLSNARVDADESSVAKGAEGAVV